MQKDYKPVSCDLYDLLTEASVQRRKLRIQTDNESDVKNIFVKDIITRNSEEFLITTEGESIRLDKVVLLPD